jgi:hypothetical protein
MYAYLKYGGREMAEQRFFEFILKPADLGRLTQAERTHLLNNTMGWVNKKMPATRKWGDSLLFQLSLFIISVILLILGFRITVSNVISNPMQFPSIPIAIAFGLITFALIWNRKSVYTWDIEGIKKGIADYPDIKESARCAFLVDYLTLLLSNPAQALFKQRAREYKAAKGKQVIIWLFFTLFFLLFAISFFYFMVVGIDYNFTNALFHSLPQNFNMYSVDVYFAYLGLAPAAISFSIMLKKIRVFRQLPT